MRILQWLALHALVSSLPRDTYIRCVNDDVLCSLIFRVIIYPLALFCFVLIGSLALCTLLCLYKMQVRCVNIFQYVPRFWRETRAYGYIRRAARRKVVRYLHIMAGKNLKLRLLQAIFLYNRIYNKILDRDWFSARLFVT